MRYNKIYLILGLILLISTLSINSIDTINTDKIIINTKVIELTEKVKDITLIDNLRSIDTVKQLTDTGDFKSYDATEKIILIEDKDYKPLIELQLTSDYNVQTYAGEDVKVAEFLLIDFNIGEELFNDAYFFDLNNDYKVHNRNYTLKYGTDYQIEQCDDLPIEDNVLLSKTKELIQYCYNITKTNWTLFNSLSELPNKNIKIGMFTDTNLGEYVEWIPNIEGVDILEWASFNISACGSLVTSNSIYLLTVDITNYADDDCMAVNANNITLDCQGHTIDGDGGTGNGYFQNADTNNIIKNCIISDFGTRGVGAVSSGNVTLINTTLRNNTINIEFSQTGGKIINSTIINGGTSGIRLFLASGVKIYNNYLNNSLDYILAASNIELNTTLTSGINILGDNGSIGGNFWANPSGTGFSENCTDSGNNGICDNTYNWQSTGIIDNLPLTYITTVTDTCTYSGTGDWIITDNCTLTTNTALSNNALILNDASITVDILANITVDKIIKINGAKISNTPNDNNRIIIKEG